jgi:hypothetical protein
VKPVAVIAIGVSLAAACLATAVACIGYRGSGWVLVAFSFAFLMLVALVFPRPRLYVYTVLTVFLALGFWLKVLVHAIWAPGFREPVGGFSGTPGQWDDALLAAAAAALGMAAARLIHLWYARRAAPRRGDNGFPPPAWFAAHRRWIWVMTIVLIVIVNLANLKFAFYQTGVNPKLLLPARLHVLASWLVNIGFALWVASLVWWEYRRDRAMLNRSLLAPILESSVATMSTYSRLAFLVHAGSYCLALLEERRMLAGSLRGKSVAILSGGLAVVLIASMAVVFWLREVAYHPPHAQDVLHTVKGQVPALFVHRWVGLEGVLAVGSAAGRGIALLQDAVLDNPKLAEKTLFQRVAKVHFLSEHPGRLTFLSNAGPVAVLLFSGSLTIVFAGMALIGLLLIATEEAARRLTGNPFLLAVSGAALANVVSQTTFFYLTLIFLLQLWVAVGFIAVLQRVRIGEG